MNDILYVKSILTDQYLQEWRGKPDQSSKSFAYFSIKGENALENYFISLQRKHYLNLFKFRTGNHKLPVEVGRSDGTPINERKCSLCTLNDLMMLVTNTYISSNALISIPNANYI